MSESDNEKESNIIELIKDENPEFTQGKGYLAEDITPKDILNFGKWIIGGAAIIFIIAMYLNILFPVSTIFDACKTILPPIVTLIIGYYFRENN